MKRIKTKFIKLTFNSLMDVEDYLRGLARVSNLSKECCQSCEDAADFLEKVVK